MRHLKRCLVLASHGKTGKRVLRKLQDLGIDVRGASRSTAIPFDWENESTWKNALEGIGSIYAVFTPDLAVPGTPKVIEDFVECAKTSAVEHIVLLSGRGEWEAQECEKILTESGVKYTILRASWFNQNFSEGFFRDDVVRGIAYVPIVKAREPFVDVEDIADVAVQCMLESRHQGKCYELTGPDLLSFHDCFKKISLASGLSIEVQEIPLAAYAKILEESGISEDAITLIRYLFSEVLDGRNESIRSDVTEILGRPALSFDRYAKNASLDKAWG